MTIDPYIILGAAIIGFLVGMTGAGGGALMTPMLILLFGIKPSTAISSVACDRQRPGRVRGIAAVVHRPRSLRATRHHVRDRRVRPEVRGRRRDGAGVDPVRDPPRRLRVVAGAKKPWRKGRLAVDLAQSEADALAQSEADAPAVEERIWPAG